MKLTDAKVLITGGSDGIGLVLAKRLKEAGAEVVIVARNKERLDKQKERLGVHAIQADVSIEADVQRMMREALELLGDVNVLVNNAAIGSFTPLLELELADYQKQVDINQTGAMLVGREVARHLVTRGGGTIINVGSVSGLRGVAGQTSYASTKFALRGMTQAWRGELRKHNIRVMYVAPSEVITDFGSKAGYPRPKSERKIQAEDIAKTITDLIGMNDRAFVTEVEVWATNPD